MSLKRPELRLTHKVMSLCVSSQIRTLFFSFFSFPLPVPFIPSLSFNSLFLENYCKVFSSSLFSRQRAMGSGVSQLPGLPNYQALTVRREFKPGQNMVNIKYMASIQKCACGYCCISIQYAVSLTCTAQKPFNMHKTITYCCFFYRHIAT